MSEITNKLEYLAPYRSWIATIALALPIFGASAGASQAQCVELSQRVPKIALEIFVADPSSMLRQLRNEKEKLAGRLAGYLATDVSVLKSLPGLMREGTQADRTAIGGGLRQAELLCRSAKPEVARKISNFVLNSGDSAILSGYSAEPDEAAPPPRASLPAIPAAVPDLMTGEFRTELADPFASIPLPQ
jgi:hypothetical protein